MRKYKNPSAKATPERRQEAVHKYKNTAFSGEELKRYRPKRPLSIALDRALASFSLSPANFRILDVGCGRGLSVAYWLSKGFDAYGGEASAQQVALAREGLRQAGFDPERIVHLDLSRGRYDLPPDSFHFVYSDNVIEHVEDLDAFAEEMARLTLCGGHGFHIFPSKWKVTEVHVRVPFVHWLPKTAVRLHYLRAMMAIGFDPGWVIHEGKPRKEAARHYFDYLDNQTHYKGHREILQTFAAAGLEPDDQLTGETVLAKLPVRKPSNKTLLRLASIVSTRFHTTVMTTRRSV